MKRIPNMAIVVAILVLISFTTDSFAQHTHKKKKATKAKHAVAASTPPWGGDIASCPVEGCGSDFDGLLNKGKNRVTPPADADVMYMSLDDIRGLAQPQKTATAPAWENNRDRSSLQGPGREGQGVRVMAYLWSAKRDGAESCNCVLDAAGILGQL